MTMERAQLIFAVSLSPEHSRDRWMIHRFPTVVSEQVLLAHISDIAGFAIFGEQVIEGLMLVGAGVFRDRLIPFLAVGEDGIDVEHDAPETEAAMLDDIADAEMRVDNGGRAHISPENCSGVVHEQ